MFRRFFGRVNKDRTRHRIDLFYVLSLLIILLSSLWLSPEPAKSKVLHRISCSLSVERAEIELASRLCYL
ncbi:MAG: hypothetical protein R3F51_05800 [Cyanobacteriota/Melainabacteria group bacterium]